MPTLQALDYSSYQGDTTYSPPKRLLVSETEYWEKYYHDPDVVFEWNNGYLEEKPVSDFLTILMSDWFSELLGYFLKTRPIAKKTFLEMGFSLTLPHKSETRRPDLGIILNSNPVALTPSDKSYGGTFDLCIEAISDSSKADIERDTVSKKADYAVGGVKEYYILDGQARYTAFYSLNAQGVYTPISAQGGIIKSTVLPGFQFRIEDLYRKPTPDDMIDDPIYQGFVLPGYSEAKQQAEKEKQARQVEEQARQKAEQRAEQAKQNAEQAKNEAQQERLRAERFAEQLRALGINPDDILTK